MKKLLFSFVSVAILMNSVSYAQEKTNNESEIVDEVISRGSVQNDPAMSAFWAGDYATAEIEFERNAFCALRATRNFEAGVQAAQNSAINSNVNGSFEAALSSSAASSGTPSPTTATQSAISRVNSSGLKNNENPNKRTCENRGFQIYMMGMSQLKLGKREEARKAFSRAVNMRKTLYDAHFRLGLLEYQDGNIKDAKKHAEKIKNIEKRCKNRCESKDEIRAQIKFLEKLLR